MTVALKDVSMAVRTVGLLAVKWAAQLADWTVDKMVVPMAAGSVGLWAHLMVAMMAAVRGGLMVAVMV